MQIRDWCKVLRKWAVIGSSLQNAAVANQVSWANCIRLAIAAREVDVQRKSEAGSSLRRLNALLGRWKSLRADLRFAWLSNAMAWNRPSGLIAAARSYKLSIVNGIQCLIGRSASRLAPVQDPLEIDFGVHRWLARDREEAYSDWFAWILNELASAELVARVLYGKGLDANSVPDIDSVHPERSTR